MADHDLRRELSIADMHTLIDEIKKNRLRGSVATETFHDENNESIVFVANNPYRIKAIIINEGNRDLYLRFKTPAIALKGIVLSPGDIYEEKEFTGNIYGIWKFNPDGSFTTIQIYITREAKLELNILIPTLKAIPDTDPTFPAFTNGTTIYKGVYSQAAALVATGTITLDAQGDSNAIFVFKVTGAVTISALATLVLTNGATSNNVFFVSDGAITLGVDSVSFGTYATIVTATIGAGATLEGRVLSSGGAIVHNGTISVPTLTSPYELGYLVNFAVFTSAGALSGTGNVLLGDVGSDLGAITILAANVQGEIYDHNSQITVILYGGVRITEITTE